MDCSSWFNKMSASFWWFVLYVVLSTVTVCTVYFESIYDLFFSGDISLTIVLSIVLNDFVVLIFCISLLIVVGDFVMIVREILTKEGTATAKKEYDELRSRVEGKCSSGTFCLRGRLLFENGYRKLKVFFIKNLIFSIVLCSIIVFCFYVIYYVEAGLIPVQLLVLFPLAMLVSFSFDYLKKNNRVDGGVSVVKIILIFILFLSNFLIGLLLKKIDYFSAISTSYSHVLLIFLVVIIFIFKSFSKKIFVRYLFVCFALATVSVSMNPVLEQVIKNEPKSILIADIPLKPENYFESGKSILNATQSEIFRKSFRNMLNKVKKDYPHRIVRIVVEGKTDYSVVEKTKELVVDKDEITGSIDYHVRTRPISEIRFNNNIELAFLRALEVRNKIKSVLDDKKNVTLSADVNAIEVLSRSDGFYSRNFTAIEKDKNDFKNDNKHYINQMKKDGDIKDMRGVKVLFYLEKNKL